MLEFTVFALSALLTYMIREFALKKKLLDMPNLRSSHTVPTPRGGGLAIIVTIAFGAFMVGEAKILLPLLPLVGISLWDDISPMSAKVRLMVQMCCAFLALYMMGGVNSINLGMFELHGFWLNILAFLFILWMTNLYNFLDGIDGYAGSEAIFVGFVAFILFDVRLGLIIACASLGFLVFNWHKASIFMGDVGSATLGFFFATLTLSQADTPYFMGWLTILSLFWFDATVTLYRRWKNKEKLSQAHKKHIYQRLHQSGWAHNKVVLFGMGLNLVFFVILSFLNPNSYWIALIAAIVILWGVLKFADTKKAFL